MLNVRHKTSDGPDALAKGIRVSARETRGTSTWPVAHQVYCGSSEKAEPSSAMAKFCLAEVVVPSKSTEASGYVENDHK